MSKGKITIIIAGGAATGALGACIVVWPAQGAILASAIAVITAAVATYTGVSINKGV